MNEGVSKLSHSFGTGFISSEPMMPTLEKEVPISILIIGLSKDTVEKTNNRQNNVLKIISFFLKVFLTFSSLFIIHLYMT